MLGGYLAASSSGFLSGSGFFTGGCSAGFSSTVWMVVIRRSLSVAPLDCAHTNGGYTVEQNLYLGYSPYDEASNK